MHSAEFCASVDSAQSGPEPMASVYPKTTVCASSLNAVTFLLETAGHRSRL
jgi:hypothetical protein